MASANVRVTIQVNFGLWWRSQIHISRVRALMGGLQPKQITRHAYPGQASTRPTPPTKPCRCVYLVIHTPNGYVVLPRFPQRPLSFNLGADVGEELRTSLIGPTRCPIISLFQIAASCPHHGDGELRWNAWSRDRFDDSAPHGTYPNGIQWADQPMRDRYDLDDDERRA